MIVRENIFILFSMWRYFKVWNQSKF